MRLDLDKKIDKWMYRSMAGIAEFDFDMNKDKRLKIDVKLA
jgi:hypothetical protein